jgi:hypothetical protein
MRQVSSLHPRDVSIQTGAGLTIAADRVGGNDPINLRPQICKCWQEADVTTYPLNVRCLG